MVERKGKLAVYATNSGVGLAQDICRELEVYAKERRESLTGKPLSFDQRDELEGIARMLERIEEERTVRGETRRVTTGDTLLKPREFRTFSDGEMNAILEESVRARDVYIVTCPYEPPKIALKEVDRKLGAVLQRTVENEILAILKGKSNAQEKASRVHACYQQALRGEGAQELFAQLANGRNVPQNVMEALILSDTLEFNHASHRTLVSPYDAYARQDAKRERESITMGLMAKLWKAAGLTHKIVMDVHSRQQAGAYDAVGVHFDNLYSTSLLVQVIRDLHGQHLPEFAMLGPDAGIGKAVKYYADRLGIEAFAIGVKIRDYDHPDRVEHKTVIIGETRTHHAIFDDMVASGGTMEAMIEPLYKRSPTPIMLVAVHPLLTGDAVERFDRLYREGKSSGFWAVGTIKRDQAFKDEHPWYHEIDPARLLAQTIYHLNMNLSVAEVYQKS